MMRDDFYGPLLGHTSHLAKEHMRGRMSRYDMTPTQTHVLLYLHEHGQAAQCVLAEHMKVRPPTANGILDRMAEKGLLVRSVDETDARRRIVRLTDKGESLVGELQKQFFLAEETIVQGFSKEEQEALKGFLRRIIDNLEVDTL